MLLASLPSSFENFVVALEAHLPHGQKPIGCKWVFTLKTNSSGEVERYKARLQDAAKGTYSPVVRYNTIRMILAIAAEYELYVRQLDVSTAYLTGILDEDIYMQQPELYDTILDVC
ncbi:hypothetical protein AWZ03_014913 [Drosophila navojoa]|uniref:Reverse transcriptase Ty1/copia-type domain-containing protein n=1 Tax=Drosophila navojoa TaxID=7232 RepID=A0A484AT05_DRONA|nr:hypothetical protein AWZ03_014913 [Drosophila navojoa]